jgi:transcription termination factor Rho
MTAKERRKMKFERWKQRRAERDAQRRGERGGERPERPERGGEGPRSQEPRPQFTQEREPEPEKPLGPPEPAKGILEMSPKGYGFLRQRDRNYSQHPLDAFIAPEFIRKYGLREGMQVVGVQCKGQRGPQITEVTEVNGRNPFVMRDLPLFEELKAVNPNKRYQLETAKDRLTTRVIDMMAPVGRGQRGLIVAPPRAGKTTMLQHIAEAVVENHPGVHLMILLVDERPEEVTEFKRILPQAEIFASNNDQDVKSHTRIATFAIERAKRLVECGEHVFMLMDSITRMARAFNNTAKSGATMSGGVGVGALEIPRRLFAAARNTRTAGSLTILGTALIETGSRMDDLIFQEFKGTGNMELVLDRRIAEQFVFPAVNIFKSGTRREELLLQAFQLDKIHMLRRGLAGHKPIEAIQRVISLLERYPSNAQMLVDLPSKS